MAPGFRCSSGSVADIPSVDQLVACPFLEAEAEINEFTDGKNPSACPTVQEEAR